jgi:hypothetical protein
MFNLLVNSPTGEQKLEPITESGYYFDESLVLWDERIDGELPEITLGKMERVDGQLVTLPDFIPDHQEALRKASIPQSVPMACARIAMANAGVLSSVQALINQMDVAAQNYFEYWPEIARNNPIVEQVRVSMGWTHDYLDDLFIAADILHKQLRGG